MAGESKGFTLIEILIATTILVLVGVSAILVEKQFMGGASTQKHKLQALGLAQEGLNAVKAKFNTNLLCTTGQACPPPLTILPGGATPAPGQIYYLDSSNNLQLCDATCSQSVRNLNNVNFTRKITFP